jgi:hypothetical protein
MHRLFLLLLTVLLCAACNTGRPPEPPSPVAISPQPGTDQPAAVESNPDEAQTEPSASSPATGEQSGTPPVEEVISLETLPDGSAPPPPPVPTPAPGPTRSGEALVNPSAPATTRNPAAQVNPSGPPPPAAGSAISSETRAVAQPFLQTVLRRDLTAAREFFSPNARPESWANVIPAEAIMGATSDFSECLGAEPVASEIPESATRHSVVFRFPTDCVQVPTMSPGAQPLQRFNGVGVQLQRVDNRWWVVGIGAFRAAS